MGVIALEDAVESVSLRCGRYGSGGGGGSGTGGAGGTGGSGGIWIGGSTGSAGVSGTAIGGTTGVGTLGTSGATTFCTVPGTDGACTAEPAPALSPAWFEADFARWPAVLRLFAALLVLAAIRLPVSAAIAENLRPWTSDEWWGRVAGSLAATDLTASWPSPPAS